MIIFAILPLAKQCSGRDQECMAALCNWLIHFCPDASVREVQPVHVDMQKMENVFPTNLTIFVKRK